MEAQYPDVPFQGPPAAYGKTPYPKRYVAIHNTSNDATAEGEASYAQRRTDGTSSHYFVDNDSIVQSLRTEFGANHAASSTGNRHAIAYEITGVNGWTRAQWLARVAWGLLARQIARDCRHHGIAARLLTPAQMQDGKTTGIVTHDLMRRAWGGTTHTDPGPNFPIDHLLSLVQAELDGDDMAQLTDADLLGLRYQNPRIEALLENYEKVRFGPPEGEVNGLRAQLDRIEALVRKGVDTTALAAAIVTGLLAGGVASPPSAEDIAALVDAKLAARLAS